MHTHLLKYSIHRQLYSVVSRIQCLVDTNKVKRLCLIHNRIDKITASTEYGGQKRPIGIGVPRSTALGSSILVDLAAKSKNTCIDHVYWNRGPEIKDNGVE